MNNYFSIDNFLELNIFGDIIFNIIKDKKNINIICIGTDRIIGDSIGPLVGNKLQDAFLESKNINVFGTIDKTVNATNLVQVINYINSKNKNYFNIAIDSCIGHKEHMNKILFLKDSIIPASTMRRNLPQIGDISICAVVNYIEIDKIKEINKYNDNLYMLDLLQNTRLKNINKMANAISNQIISAILKANFKPN